MPTLIRLVLGIVVIVACAYAAMFALAYLVTPGQEEMTIQIPVERLTP